MFDVGKTYNIHWFGTRPLPDEDDACPIKIRFVKSVDGYAHFKTESGQPLQIAECLIGKTCKISLDKGSAVS